MNEKTLSPLDSVENAVEFILDELERRGFATEQEEGAKNLRRDIVNIILTNCFPKEKQKKEMDDLFSQLFDTRELKIPPTRSAGQSSFEQVVNEFLKRV